MDMTNYDIYLNGKLYLSLSRLGKPSVNEILEKIQQERIAAQTNLDQVYRTDLGIEIEVREV